MTGQLALPGHQNTTETGATISDCGTYRYALWRTWDPSLPVAVFVMLNPSTADGDQDDPTIRKCIGFARRWGCGGIYVVNLFAYRATYPKDLRLAYENPVGPENREHVKRALWLNQPFKERRGPCVAAWGSQPTKRMSQMVGNQSALLQHKAADIPVRLQCLGTTKDGNPRHPLMVPYATELQPWP